MTLPVELAASGLMRQLLIRYHDRLFQNKTGFSIIELLIVVSITLLLMAVAIPIYGNFQSSSYLNERTAEIVQTVRTAQARSLARVNNKPHGVFFDIGRRAFAACPSSAELRPDHRHGDFRWHVFKQKNGCFSAAWRDADLGLFHRVL